MQKYVIKRVLKQIEFKEIVVENWNEATEALKKFSNEPIPENSVLIIEECNIEFVGDTHP